MSRNPCLAVIIAILMVMCVAACGGGNAGLSGLSRNDGAPAPDTDMAGAQLPAPLELERNPSEVSAQRDRRGEEYIPQLSSGDNITVGDKSCTMDPLHMGSWRLSYAGWRFSLPEYGDDPVLHVALNPLKPQLWDDLYVGLSNWESNRWDWFSLPAGGELPLADMQAYINPYSEALYVVVLTDRDAELSIRSLRFGGQQLPMARLKADKYFVGTGVSVNLSAKLSEAFEGNWVKTEIDPEGDGSWTDTLGSSSLSHAYPAEGLYIARLRITDSFGNQGHAETGIYVSDGAYHEVEDNDSLELANPVPGEGFAGLVGNIGKGGAHADAEDWYSFSLEQSSYLHLSVAFGGSDDYVFTDLLRIREGQEPELIERDSSKTHDEMYLTVPPGDYAVRIWDFKDTDTMDKTYAFGIDASASEAPVVVIAPWDGQIGYQDALAIDLSGSYDPDGSIVEWEIDLYGDGVYEHVNLIDGMFNLTQDKRPGTFQAMARVTDDSGLTTERSFSISIEGQPEYNILEEEEFNDYDSGQAMPAFDFSKLRGALGDGSDYYDIFSFSTAVPGTIQFDIDNLTEESGLLVINVDQWIAGDWVSQDSLLGDGSLVLPAAPAGEYRIYVHTSYGSALYDLAGSFTP